MKWDAFEQISAPRAWRENARALAEQPTMYHRNRISPKVKGALIALCLCVAAVGTVFASETLWGFFARTPIRDNISTGYRYSVQGLIYFPHELAGEDLKEEANAQEEARAAGENRRNITLTYESWDKLKGSFGIALAENKLLEELWSKAGEGLHCYVDTVSGTGGGVASATAVVNCLLPDSMDTQIIFIANFVTDLCDEVQGVFMYGKPSSIQSQDYKMPDGGTATLTFTESAILDDVFTNYNASFIMGGLMYHVTISSNHNQGKNLEQLLYDILDQFEA